MGSYYFPGFYESIFNGTDDFINDEMEVKDELGLDDISVEYEYVDSIIDYMSQIKENKDLILIVNSGNYDAMIENDNLLESEKIYFASMNGSWSG